MEQLAEILQYTFKPGVIVMTFLALSFLVMAIIRSFQLPQCFSCGAMKVRPSRPVGLLDSLGGLLLIRPHRCSGCRERFYALRVSAGTRPQSKQSRSQRGLAVAFRVRNGVVDRVAFRVVKDSISARPAVDFAACHPGTASALSSVQN